MSIVKVTINGGVYRVTANVLEDKPSGTGVIVIQPQTGEGDVALTFDSAAGMMTFAGQVGEAVMKAFRGASTNKAEG